MADIYNIKIPKDPAIAEFAFAVLQQITAQNELNTAMKNAMQSMAARLRKLEGGDE